MGTRVLLHVCRAGERGGFFFLKRLGPLKKTRGLPKASHMEWLPSCCTRAWVVRGFVPGSHSDMLARLSLANHRAPVHSLKRSRTRVRECVVRWAFRTCGEEGSSLRGRGKLRGLRVVVSTRTVLRWPRPIAVASLLAGASWWEPDLVVKREMLLCTGGHTHQSAQMDNTGNARRRWS